MNPLRWGLLSTARINGSLVAGARATAAAEIVAVASRDGARAEAFARAVGAERSHASYEALLADPEVDAIYNPLPNSMYVEWSIRALAAASTCSARNRSRGGRPTSRRRSTPPSAPGSCSPRRSCGVTRRRRGGCASCSTRRRSGGCGSSARRSRSRSRARTTFA